MESKHYYAPITQVLVTVLGGCSLPGEPCRYAPHKEVPRGWLEVYGTIDLPHGRYLCWKIGPAEPGAMDAALRLRNVER